MTEIYVSKNSRYYFKGQNLMRIKGERETSWEETVYVPKESLKELLKKYQIPGKKQVPIKIHIGDKFLKELKEKAMDLTQKGGRFVSLIEDIDSYTLFYSSNIIDIKTEKTKEDNDDEIRIEA
jgi:DNA-directed RNA polymerase subunit H (RpoH/RPB5)